tara:strand:+ start:112 stop:306 length:195 start_codon:yes stop_codon:yes gene_type:complete
MKISITGARTSKGKQRILAPGYSLIGWKIAAGQDEIVKVAVGLGALLLLATSIGIGLLCLLAVG